ncbi:FAD-dependent oxidoreductase [Erythrobacter sp.]|uniref:flavin monoamine oxidase family protein n=1 Tax=Erythrobacter sp. TaxID=1042 RepID=UPI001425F5C2|nr:FAD-dependent oxidoreductase [Erythrobacter sp.]QIQ87929.1 MAG: NAD(P)-binding protein [Erythrobacter sp.]
MNLDRRTMLAALAAGFTLPSASLRAEPVGGARLVGHLRTNWSRAPFALGSYSYVARGERPDDRRTLAEPVAGRLFFAGEACHPDYGGTVHAAYESGIAAASRMLAQRHGRIAVIGAGIAGLAAAQALAQGAHEVVVFEASERIGGRIRTSRELGLPLDLGASWIHGATGNPLTALADGLGLSRVETGESYAVRDGAGRRVRAANQPDWLFREAEAQIAFGADIDLLAPEALDKGDGYEGADMILPEGYDRLLGGLKRGHGYHLSHPVRAVRLDAAGVTLEVEGIGRRPFDAALVTVPLGVLKAGSIAFDPPLPEEKRAAIGRIGMGVLDKLYLKFDRVFWDDATWLYTPDTGLQRGQFNQWLNLHGIVGEPVLLALNGGSSALALAGLGDEKLVGEALGVLRRAYRL